MIVSKKGFTLVELIVVITILAILGTIAFLSLQGYSSDARNAKRNSDLNNISKKIELLRLTGVGLSAFVSDGTSSLSGSTVGTGAKIRISGHEGGSALTGVYMAGNINFTVLGEKAEGFLDPLFEKYYKIGYTGYGQQFELAATIEDDGDFDSLVVGTWSPRKSAEINYAKSSHNSNIAYLSGIVVNQTGLRLGDLIRFDSDLNGTYKILKLKGDQITVDQTITHTGSTIFLHGDETRSLIKRWDSDNAIDFGKGYKYTPYYK